jgi:hypothetical protein
MFNENHQIPKYSHIVSSVNFGVEFFFIADCKVLKGVYFEFYGYFNPFF